MAVLDQLLRAEGRGIVLDDRHALALAAASRPGRPAASARRGRGGKRAHPGLLWRSAGGKRAGSESFGLCRGNRGRDTRRRDRAARLWAIRAKDVLRIARGAAQLARISAHCQGRPRPARVGEAEGLRRGSTRAMDPQRSRPPAPRRRRRRGRRLRHAPAPAQVGEALGAPRFIDITRAHVDGCLHHGEVSLDFVAPCRGRSAAACACRRRSTSAPMDLIHPELFRGPPALAADGRALMELHEALGCLADLHLRALPDAVPPRLRRADRLGGIERHRVRQLGHRRPHRPLRRLHRPRGGADRPRPLCRPARPGEPARPRSSSRSRPDAAERLARRRARRRRRRRSSAAGPAAPCPRSSGPARDLDARTTSRRSAPSPPRPAPSPCSTPSASRRRRPTSPRRSAGGEPDRTVPVTAADLGRALRAAVDGGGGGAARGGGARHAAFLAAPSSSA